MLNTRSENLPYRKNVGLMIINTQKKIFMGQRIKGGAWKMPQGGIDGKETPEKAAIRELYEETGITKEKINKISTSKLWKTYEFPKELIPKLWNGRYRGQIQKWFLFQYTGKDSDINISSTEQEFSNWRWTNENDLLKLIVPFKKAVYIDVISEFRDKIEALE
jgi:putative (di)nucleoside polyphosphate hydrolase